MTTCPVCQAKISSFGGYYVTLPENQGPRAHTEAVCSRRCLLIQQTDAALSIERRIGIGEGAAAAKRQHWWQR